VDKDCSSGELCGQKQGSLATDNCGRGLRELALKVKVLKLFHYCWLLFFPEKTVFRGLVSERRMERGIQQVGTPPVISGYKGKSCSTVFLFDKARFP